jgi:DNA-binding MarR family transcriptional regulator
VKIDQAIRQNKGFENEMHRLRVNLLFTTNWMVEEIRQFLEPFDLTQKQFNILRILRGDLENEKGMAVQDLRNRMIDRMSDTSRLVDRLRKKDLVDRKPCTEDKRITRVRISSKGLELLERIDGEMHRMDAITRGLTEEEARQLNILLDKLRSRDEPPL